MTAAVVAVLLGAAVLAWPVPPSPVGRERPHAVRGPSPHRKRLRWRSGTHREQEAWHGILTMLESIGPAVCAGVVPAVAVSTAADLLRAGLPSGVLAGDIGRLAGAARRGDELAEEWARLADRHGMPGLQVVARAWSLCEELGCGLAESIDAAVGAMRAEEEQRRRVRVATAGPRATMQLLTLLPVAGIGLCALMGINPAQLYAGRVLVFTAIPGAILLLAGRALVRRMMRRACRPEALR